MYKGNCGASVWLWTGCLLLVLGISGTAGADLIVNESLGELKYYDSAGNGRTIYNDLFLGFGDVEFGPDGDLYALNHQGIYRFSGSDYRFLGKFDSGYDFSTPQEIMPNPPPLGEWTYKINIDMAFGPDGYLYVTSGTTTATHSNTSGDFSTTVLDTVLRFNGQTGAFVDEFIKTDGTFAFYPFGIEVGPSNQIFLSNSVGLINRYDGSSGAFIDGQYLPYPSRMALGPDGNVYVLSQSTYESADRGIYRINGSTGAVLDRFIDLSSVTGTHGDETIWIGGLDFGPDGDLYLSEDIQFYSPELGFHTSGRIGKYDGQTGQFIDYVHFEDDYIQAFAVTPVPEPSTLALLVLSLLGVLGRVYRRKSFA